MKLLVFFALVVPTLGYPQTSRIYNGYEAREGQFPYQISLQVELFGLFYTHICGGSIVDEQKVLTAGHCLDDPTHLYVTVGDHDLFIPESQEKRLKVEEVIRHPNYTVLGEPNDKLYDLGVLKFKESAIKFNDYVQPSNFAPRDYDATGRTCTVSGWGTMETEESPAILRYVDVDVLEFEKCKGQWQLFGSPVYPNTVCSKNKGFTYYGPGPGDSGGPYSCPDEDGVMTQIGIVSSGPVEGFLNLPAMYTEVRAFRSWIYRQ